MNLNKGPLILQNNDVYLMRPALLILLFEAQVLYNVYFVEASMGCDNHHQPVPSHELLQKVSVLIENESTSNF